MQFARVTVHNFWKIRILINLIQSKIFNNIYETTKPIELSFVTDI